MLGSLQFIMPRWQRNSSWTRIVGRPGRCPSCPRAARGSSGSPSRAAACQSFIIIFLRRTCLQDAHQPRVLHFAARLPRSLARSPVVSRLQLIAPCRGALLANFSPSAFQLVKTDSSDGVKQRDEDRRDGNGRRVERGRVGQRTDPIACPHAGCRVFVGAVHCGARLGDGGGFLRQPCAMLSMPEDEQALRCSPLLWSNVIFCAT